MMTDILTNEIYARRKSLLKSFRGSSCIIITKPANIFYYSGFLTDTGMLVYNGKWHMLTDARYTLKASGELVDTNLIEVDHINTYLKILEEIIDSKAVYIEENSMGITLLNNLRLKLKNHFFAGADDIIEGVRRIKSDYEIDLLKHAAAIADDALSRTLPLIKAGVSERDIACEIEYRMKKLGADKTSFDTIALSGPDGAMPHGMPGNHKIKEGEFLTLDFGCIYKGYCSDMTRTFAIGNISEDMKYAYETVLSAQNKAISNIRSGIMGSMVDKIARDLIDDSGYTGCFSHGLGHSLGIEIHESPNFNKTERTLISENMVLSVEPGIYIPKKFGVRIEDVIIVKKSGCINLTRSSKKLYHL